MTARRVRRAGGQELHFQTARENQAVLPLRAADFPAGNYELILSPDTPDPKTIDRYPFADQEPSAQLQFQTEVQFQCSTKADRRSRRVNIYFSYAAASAAVPASS